MEFGNFFTINASSKPNYIHGFFFFFFFIFIFYFFYFLSSFLYSCSFLSQWVPCTYETYVGLIYHNFLPFSFCIVTINCQNLNRIQIWYYTILCSIFMLNVWPLSIPKFNIYIYEKGDEKKIWWTIEGMVEFEAFEFWSWRWCLMKTFG